MVVDLVKVEVVVEVVVGPGLRFISPARRRMSDDKKPVDLAIKSGVRRDELKNMT